MKDRNLFKNSHIKGELFICTSIIRTDLYEPFIKSYDHENHNYTDLTYPTIMKDIEFAKKVQIRFEFTKSTV